jgi:hypothetical protein
VSSTRTFAVLCLLVAAGLAIAAPARAQSPAPAGRLRVTVADPSGAVIPRAEVIVARQGAPATAASAAPAIAPALTAQDGAALVAGLAPGRYTIVARFPGFETVTVRDVQVRTGEVRRTVTLPIEKIAEDVVVDRDGRSASLDPRGDAFSTVLTREQIALLPDDPDEMEAALKAMSPPGAVMRIDGFTGGTLPPKQQIRSIRLPRMDMLAAQNHGGMMGMMHIDIMTQPGGGPIRGSVDFTLRDDMLNARNPFVPDKGDEGLRQGGVTLSGGIVPNTSSFSVTVQRASIFNTGSLLAAVPGRTLADSVRQPGERLNLFARFDQAMTPDHALRVTYSQTDLDNRNLGAGGFDLPERAFTRETTDRTLRISHNGPVGQRFFSESRLQVRWSESEATSALEAPAIRVLDAFTSGGAQRAGGRRGVDLEAATDLDYVRGRHSMRAGVLVEAGRYRSDDTSNYLGTFTFASLADYEAGRPSNYTSRTGDPLVRYSKVQFGAYAQDDYRLLASLLLSYGVRYEAQTLIPDQTNVSPRVSVTWSPLASGRTTFRGGWGLFTDWLGTDTYEQTLRVDGTRQREVNIVNPEFPDPGGEGLVLPTNRYQLGAGMVLPESMMANAGVDQKLTDSLRVSGTYTYRRGSKLLRGRNLNAPVAGVRPDPAFANVVEVIDDAESRIHSLGVNASFVKLDWRQTFMMVSYTMTASETNATGAFGLPANGDDLDAEWGAMLPRHRLGGAFNMRPVGGLAVAVNARAQSGTPYDVTTGFDDNGDGVFNDRPAGTARNAARTAAQWDLGLRLSYTIGFGQRPQSSGPGGMVVVMGGGGGMPGGFTGGAAGSRFRLEFYASAQNVTNHENLSGYSGVVTSPFFGRATNVLNPRKVELGVRFGF